MAQKENSAAYANVIISPSHRDYVPSSKTNTRYPRTGGHTAQSRSTTVPDMGLLECHRCSSPSRISAGEVMFRTRPSNGRVPGYHVDSQPLVLLKTEIPYDALSPGQLKSTGIAYSKSRLGR